MDLKIKAKPREQLLALLATLGILVFFIRAVYFPKRIAAAQWGVQIHNMELEKQALEKFTQALLQQIPKEKVKAEVSPQLRILRGELSPYAEATSHLLAQWSAPQFLRGVEIKKLSDLAPKPQEGFFASNFAMQVLGPFRQVFSLLDRIEKFPALVTIDTILLKTLDSKASRVELELNGTLYQLEKL